MTGANPPPPVAMGRRICKADADVR